MRNVETLITHHLKYILFFVNCLLVILRQLICRGIAKFLQTFFRIKLITCHKLNNFKLERSYAHPNVAASLHVHAPYDLRFGRIFQKRTFTHFKFFNKQSMLFMLKYLMRNKIWIQICHIRYKRVVWRYIFYVDNRCASTHCQLLLVGFILITYFVVTRYCTC